MFDAETSMTSPVTDGGRAQFNGQTVSIPIGSSYSKVLTMGRSIISDIGVC